MFRAPNQVAGTHIITPRRVPKQEIIKVSMAGTRRFGTKEKSIPMKRPAEVNT